MHLKSYHQVSFNHVSLNYFCFCLCSEIQLITSSAPLANRLPIAKIAPFLTNYQYMKNLFLFFLLEFPASLKIVAKKGGWLIDRYHQQTHRKKKENRMTSWYIHSAGECYPHLFAINHGNSTSNNIPRIYMQRDG